VKGFTRREALALAAGSLFGAQQDDVTFKAGVKVVNILASVRTKKGEFVTDLTKDDFTILENGKPQTIRYFSRETDLPLTLGLMVDTSMSQQRVLEQERSACFHFLDQVLRPDKDKVFIMQFDMAVMLRQELTGSHHKLDEVLAVVDTPTRSELQMQQGAGTLLYDAMFKGARDVMANQLNRKALIVMTDGVDTGSETSLAAAIEAAQRTDTLIYSIEFSDEGYYGGFPGMGPDGKGVLVRMAKETGGSFFAVTKKRSIDQIFDMIQMELRSQYSIGYVSDEPVRISEFRKLQLTADRKGLSLQYRDRYWAQR
jgi:VWFA-related protein